MSNKDIKKQLDVIRQKNDIMHQVAHLEDLSLSVFKDDDSQLKEVASIVQKISKDFVSNVFDNDYDKFYNFYQKLKESSNEGSIRCLKNFIHLRELELYLAENIRLLEFYEKKQKHLDRLS